MRRSPLWPEGFVRVPDEGWTRAPIEDLAVRYDSVEAHGWYANLEPTLRSVLERVRRGDVLVDYSGGTGILCRRILDRLASDPLGIILVDSSPKFLRLSLAKFSFDERVAFRLLKFHRTTGKLDLLEEVLDPKLWGKVSGVLSTNAVHLYFDLEETIASWRRVTRSGGWTHIQSGNIRSPFPGSILDDTVEGVFRWAKEIVERDSRFERYRPLLSDEERMRSYERYLQRVFPPPRPLEEYRSVLLKAGYVHLREWVVPIAVRRREWEEFLSVYHDPILGWIGGSPKVEGKGPDARALEDRHLLLREALKEALGGKEEFFVNWIYLEGEVP